MDASAAVLAKSSETSLRPERFSFRRAGSRFRSSLSASHIQRANPRHQLARIIASALLLVGPAKLPAQIVDNEAQTTHRFFVEVIEAFEKTTNPRVQAIGGYLATVSGSPWEVRGKPAAEEALVVASQLASADATVQYYYALYCITAESTPDSACAVSDGLAAYAATDPRNAWPSIFLAERARRNKDLEAEHEYLDRAAHAAIAEDYYREAFATVLHAVETTTLAADKERLGKRLIASS